MQAVSGLALSAGGMAGGRLLAPCPLRAATAFRGANAVQPPSARRRLVCQARDKGVGPLLRKAMTPTARTPDLAFQSAATYLRGLGITNQSELTMVLDIAMNPYSVYGKASRKQAANPHARRLSVEEDIKPVVEFLLALGLDQAAVGGAIMRHPPLLCYSVEDRLAPLVEFLQQELRLSREQLVQALQARPNLLGLDLESVRRMVGYLAASGKSTEEIAQLLQSSL